MDQRIIDLYDEYTHKPLDRQVFLKKLIKLTGSTALAMAALPMLENNYAFSKSLNSLDLTVEEVDYPGVKGSINAMLAKPKTESKYGAVVVIHENRGLNPHIKDVAKRIANEGFLTLAIDALSPFGGTPTDEDKARELIGDLDKSENLKNYLLGLDYVRTRSDSNGKTACVGFCWGGGMANQLAVNDAKLDAAVAYYGMQPSLDEVKRIKAKLLLHYAGLDQRINAGIPAYEEALKAAGVDYKLYLYEGANHAFNNDASPARYHEQAAKLAWERTINLLEDTIGS